MKTVPTGLATKLASGVTTLCNCWRIARTDGVVLGFTDCDANVTFGGLTYQADSGFSGSAFAQREGLSVDTLDAHSALSAGTLTEDDLAKGLWDNAAVEVWRVDWSDVADRVQIFGGSIGEVERGPLAFRSELRSLAHHLNQPEGRSYAVTCDADVGDARCGVNLSSASFTASATVSAIADIRSRFSVSGLSSFTQDWFKRGRVLWVTGANAAIAVEVKRHTLTLGVATIELSTDTPFDVVVGDTLSISAGCDKTIATCFAKYNNVLNHRGFPQMPGNDWITSYPNQGDGNDGGSQSGTL